LTVVPHGALHYLPFNALYTGSAHLIDRYTLRVLPSASVLAFLKIRRVHRAKGMLVLGNPDLGDPRYDLPFSEREAVRVAANRPGAEVLVRERATETVVKEFARRFRVVHFATHSVFDPKEPLGSALLLAADASNDGALTVRELFDLELNADLVTLSGCETALGTVFDGDDVVGFTRGFLYAGARSVISSLWAVNDEATSILMQRFYARQDEIDRRDALRLAQLEVKEHRAAHPFFWAAFQFSGSGGVSR
jgi:CHAT domain-containing protein